MAANTASAAVALRVRLRGGADRGDVGRMNRCPTLICSARGGVGNANRWANLVIGSGVRLSGVPIAALAFNCLADIPEVMK